LSTHAGVLIAHVSKGLEKGRASTPRLPDDEQHLAAADGAGETIEKRARRCLTPMRDWIQEIGPRLERSEDGRGDLDLQVGRMRLVHCD